MRTPLPIAVRVYPDLPGSQPDRGRTEPYGAMLIFDCETRIDQAQALTFGSYRFVVQGRCIQEGLFYADDLTAKEMATLRRYVRTHRAETDPHGLPEEGIPSDPELQLLPVAEFRKLLYRVGYKGRALLVAFNFPFDASRLALSWVPARRRFLGGFTLNFFEYVRDGRFEPSRYRPGISIKHMDSKRSIKRFTAPIDRDKEDRIPEGSVKPNHRYSFRGHMLDAKTLAFALTDRSMSLKVACETFGVQHGKHKVKRHGVVTPKYIDYNRRDVLATQELTEKLLVEYTMHPIALQVTKAYSPASIGKAYLEAMGITPIRTRVPDFPKPYLGYAQSAFYGGRASAHVRKVPVPVIYTDFMSQYSTVNVLMGLWSFVTAADIRVIEDAREELAMLLSEVTPQWVLDPSNWKRLTGFARIIPNGDVLPLRAQYAGNDWQIGMNHAYAKGPTDALWYSWPDLVASVLLTGKLPQIVEAFKLEAIGQVAGLKPITFRGQVSIDPRSQDFFKTVIEERNRIASDKALDENERKRLTKSLKTFGSATSYGIFAQMDRQEREKKIALDCYGIAEPYRCSVAHPEAPGEYCFPPLASLITGGSRLLLALLERLVTDRGGTYAMEDTDSMAIVASQRGGLIACAGGPYRTEDGREAIRALRWEQVEEIVALIDRLNPYDRSAVKTPILKIEADNYDPKTGKPRQLWCLAISAKRYVLFLRDRNGEPVLLRENVNAEDDRWSQHGLGHLLNPADLDDEDRTWTAAVWLGIVRKSLGLPAAPLSFAQRIAVGQTTISSPAVLQPFSTLNAGKRFAAQVKPFNFMLSAHLAEHGAPSGADPQRFRLIAPYERDPRKWPRLPWIDQYSEKRYNIGTTVGPSRFMACVQSYADVLEAYESHPEAKCADARGQPCGEQTCGLLGRRHVTIEWPPRFIGKESNKLEDVEEGGVADASDVYTEYPDPRCDEWKNKWLPMLGKTPVPELLGQGVSRATIYAACAGRPVYRSTKAKLISMLKGLAEARQARNASPRPRSG